MANGNSSSLYWWWLNGLLSLTSCFFFRFSQLLSSFLSLLVPILFYFSFKCVSLSLDFCILLCNPLLISPNSFCPTQLFLSGPTLFGFWVFLNKADIDSASAVLLHHWCNAITCYSPFDVIDTQATQSAEGINEQPLWADVVGIMATV